MKKVKFILALLLTGLMMFILAGCGSSVSNSKQVYFVSHDNLTGYPGMLFDALNAEAQSSGYTLESTDAEMDANKQIDQMNEVIAKKPAAIVLLPVEAQALKPSVEKANAAGIPVVVTNRDIAGGEVATVYSDEEQSGRLQGEYMAQHLKQGAKIVYFMGDSSLTSAHQRWENFKSNCLDKRPDIELLASTDAGWNKSEAVKYMSMWLKIFPQIDAVVAGNDEMALGAIEAMKAAGRLNSDVLVTGIDAEDTALQKIAAGEMSQTVKQDAGASAKSIWELVEKMVKSGQTTDNVKVPFINITRDNISQFLN